MNLSNPANATIADAQGAWHDHRRRPAAVAGGRRRVRDRGQLRHDDATFTVALNAPSGRRRHRQLRDSRRHGVAPARLRGRDRRRSPSPRARPRRRSPSSSTATCWTRSTRRSREPCQARQRSDRRRPGAGDDHRRRPAARARDRRRDGHRGQHRHRRRHVHRHPQRPERPSRLGRLRDGRRDGDRAGRLRGGERRRSTSRPARRADGHVLVNGDVLDELDETFAVNLSNPVNATIADAQGVGTISDDDGPPSVSVNDATVTEGNGNSVTASFTRQPQRASGQPARVNYATAERHGDGPGRLHGASPATLTFAPGQMTQTVTVMVAGDVLDEIDETFTSTCRTPSTRRSPTARARDDHGQRRAPDAVGQRRNRHGGQHRHGRRDLHRHLEHTQRAGRLGRLRDGERHRDVACRLRSGQGDSDLRRGSDHEAGHGAGQRRCPRRGRTRPTSSTSRTRRMRRSRTVGSRHDHGRRSCPDALDRRRDRHRG